MSISFPQKLDRESNKCTTQPLVSSLQFTNKAAVEIKKTYSIQQINK